MNNRDEDIEDFAKGVNGIHVQTSALSGIGVEYVFDKIIEFLMKKDEAKEKLENEKKNKNNKTAVTKPDFKLGGGKKKKNGKKNNRKKKKKSCKCG